MLTDTSLWGIYTASYLVDYIILLGISIYKQIDQYINPDKMAEISFFQYCRIGDYIAWGVLLFLIVFSVICAHSLKSMHMNTRIKYEPKDNISLETASYIVPYVLTIITIIFSDYWLIMSAAIFVVVGVLFVKSKKVQWCPVFIIPMGYRILQCEECVVITNYSQDGLRFAVQSNADGVEARELENGVYLVKK